MFRQIATVFLGWRVMILLFALLAYFFIPLNYNQACKMEYLQFPRYFSGVWANFDGKNYIYIAEHGYNYPNFAYFPLLPLLISFIHGFRFLPSLESGLLVVNVAFLLSLFALYKTILLDFKKKVVWRVIILLLAFPVSFFYGVVYTESLYFLFSILSFYFARKANWFWAGFFGFVVGLSRLVGISLFLALAVEWFIQNKKITSFKKLAKAFFRTRAYFIFLIPLAIISYALYLQIYFGDFLLFQKSMSHWGQGKFVFPPQVVFRYLKFFLLVPKNIVYFVAVLEFVSTIFYFLLSFYVLKKIRISYGIWMLVSLTIPTFTGTFQSMPRYILHLFPAFIALAMLTSGSKKIFWATVGVFLLLQFILVALFTCGYFVA